MSGDLRSMIDAARTPEFMDRLQRRITEDATILARLRDSDDPVWFGYEDGHAVVWHRCGEHIAEATLPNGPWRVVVAEPLTVEPSIACSACGLHGWIRDGHWLPAASPTGEGDGG